MPTPTYGPGSLRAIAEYQVTCGACNTQERRAAYCKLAAARALRERGWKLTAAHGWLCPECA